MSIITSDSFLFNGINSRDYGIMIAGLDSSDTDVSVNGLNREIRKNADKNKLRHTIYGAEHTDVITFSFSIVKADGTEFTRSESIKINGWLTSSALPQKLQFIDSDPCPLHYYAICRQIKDYVYGGKLIGKELQFETDSPFAFSDKTEKIYEIPESTTFGLYNYADTYNNVYYPVITLVTSSDSVIIENITDRKSVTINTVRLHPDGFGNKTVRLDSEKLTVSGQDNRLIPADRLGWNAKYRSYVSSLDGYIDFIYWPRLLKGLNEIKVTGSCSLKIEYEYPRKAGCL